jgi:hypothetical protein
MNVTKTMYKMNAFIRDDALASINEVIFFLVVDFFFDTPLRYPAPVSLFNLAAAPQRGSPSKPPNIEKMTNSRLYVGIVCLRISIWRVSRQDVFVHR